MKKMYMKILIIYIFVVFTCTPIISSNAINQVVEKSLVTNYSKTLYVGGNGSGNYTSIQDAIDNTSDGDLVFVFDESSPYYENVTVDKSIQLIGEDKESTIIDAQKNGSVIFITSNSVTITGFTLQNSGDEFYSGGVALKSNYNLVTGNVIVYNTNGVCIKDCEKNTVSKNIISYNTIGEHPYNYYGAIYIRDSNYNNIIDNIIENNDNPGLFLLSSHYNEIKKNVVSLNTRCGIRLGMDYTTRSNNNIFSENTIIDNTGWAITIGDCTGNQIISNNIYDSVNLYLSKNTLISKNNFINSGSTFSYIFEERKSYNNEWKSNYWNRPRFFPKLIKGDVVGIQGWGGFYFRYFRWYQIDWNPAKEPYDIPGSSNFVGCGKK